MRRLRHIYGLLWWFVLACTAPSQNESVDDRTGQDEGKRLPIDSSQLSSLKDARHPDTTPDLSASAEYMEAEPLVDDLPFDSADGISGSWGYDTPDSSLEFSLVLRLRRDSLIGRHCATASKGNLIDCAEDAPQTLAGKADQSGYTGWITSTYSNERLRFRLAVDKVGRLHWRLTSSPTKMQYIPKQAVLRRE